VIEAGNGTIAGQNKFIKYIDLNPLTISGVGVAVYDDQVIYSTFDSM